MVSKIVFIVATTILAVGWLKWKISTLAMIYYIEKKGYTQPSKKEMAECTRYVAEHLLK